MKISIEALHQRSPMERAKVPFEGVGRWILVTDVVLVLLASLVVGSVTQGFHASGDMVRHLAIAVIFLALLLPIGEIRGHYHPSVVFNLGTQLTGLMATWLGISMLLIFVAFGLKIGADLSRTAIATFGATGFALAVANRLGWAWATRRAHAQGLLRTNKIALLTIGEAVHKGLRNDLIHHGYEIVVRGHIGSYLDADGFDRVLREFTSGIRGSEIREILLLVPSDALSGVPDLLERLRMIPLPIQLIPEPPIGALFERSWKNIGGTIAVQVQREPIGFVARVLKRSLDFAVAATALVMLSPLLFGVAMAIKLDSPGPVLFRQARRGFNGRPFRIIKFRSMRVLEDGAVIDQAVRNDMRITRIGRFIRRTSIDELPQLFNVLSGEMSLVGPRPHALAHDAYYDSRINDYAMRQHVKPGLTGWAQVNGHRGLTPTLESMEQRVLHDLWYIDNWSVWLDLKILALTVREVIMSRHAF